MTDVLMELEGEVAIVTLNRPARRNALSLGLMQELTVVLRSAAGQARVIVLAASGKVFSSGHDLGEMVNRTEADYQEIFRTCTELMETVQQVEVPVIAEVQGLATAAGCQLVASCDLVVASEEAGFATPGVKIGLFCTTPMVALTRVIGSKRAMEMLLTGDVISAQTAADWGLVNRVVPVSELRAVTLALARRIAQASAYTIALGKKAFYRQLNLDRGPAYEYAGQVMTTNALAHDAQEGMGAFLAKRQPIWKAR
jgi:enoyl-CoA hydratase/carnithine racemase